MCPEIGHMLSMVTLMHKHDDFFGVCGATRRPGPVLAETLCWFSLDRQSRSCASANPSIPARPGPAPQHFNVRELDKKVHERAGGPHRCHCPSTAEELRSPAEGFPSPGRLRPPAEQGPLTTISALPRCARRATWRAPRPSFAKSR